MRMLKSARSAWAWPNRDGEDSHQELYSQYPHDHSLKLFSRVDADVPIKSIYQSPYLLRPTADYVAGTVLYHTVLPLVSFIFFCKLTDSLS